MLCVLTALPPSFYLYHLFTIYKSFSSEVFIRHPASYFLKNLNKPKIINVLKYYFIALIIRFFLLIAVLYFKLLLYCL